MAPPRQVLPPTSEKPQAPAAPPNPYGLDPRVAPYLQPQLDLIKTQEDQQRKALSDYTAAVLAQLGQFAPQIGNDYNQAIDQSRALAQAGADSLKAANQSGDISAILSAAGAPSSQQSQITANLGNVFNGGAAALFGSRGVVPGQALIADKAAAQGFANELPGINSLAGVAALKNLLARGEAQRQQVLAQSPTILNQLAQQDFAQKKFGADQAYRQSTLGIQQANAKRQAANDAFGQWYKQQELKLSGRRLSNQEAAQSFNQWAKQQGIDARWAQVDIAQRKLAIQQKGKQGLAKYTPSQISRFRATAADTAHDAFWGHVDPKTGKMVVGPQSYQQAMGFMLQHGIPLAIAQQALNQYWTKPGFEADAQSRLDAKGDKTKVVWDRATKSGGRPLVPFQQRSRGKGSAVAEPAAYVTVAPGANRAGVGLNPSVVDFVGQIGKLAGRKLTIGTGTNHNEFVVGTNRKSAHWTGNAADIPASGSELTKLGQDALIAAGADPAWARRQTGGLYNIGGVQVIFNSMEGGNHFNHLHVGLRSMA